MRKMLLVLTAIAFIGSFCFVQLPQAKAEETKTFVGKVGSVEKRIGKPPKWTYAILTVVADGGEKMAWDGSVCITGQKAKDTQSDCS